MCRLLARAIMNAIRRRWTQQRDCENWDMEGDVLKFYIPLGPNNTTRPSTLRGTGARQDDDGWWPPRAAVNGGPLLRIRAAYSAVVLAGLTVAPDRSP
eukprot:7555911-Pyramimonas_sp.AAC.1